MNAQQPILEVKNLTKTFGDNTVLKGIDLTVSRGDVIAILGPSGCGKSTFLRCLNCMEDPSGGTILFRGENLVDMKVDINKHRQHIGMVFQQFNLFNNKTVLENITLAPIHVQKTALNKKKLKNFFIRIKNLFKKEKTPLEEINVTLAEIKKSASEKAFELLKKVGLEDKANVYPSTLSGGQKQRVSIARAFLKNPSISPLILLIV